MRRLIRTSNICQDTERQADEPKSVKAKICHMWRNQFVTLYITGLAKLILKSYFSHSLTIRVEKNMIKKEKLLVSAMRKVVPKVEHEWNCTKLAMLEKMLERKFFKYFTGKPTEERTKIVSPFLDVIFARLMQKELSGFRAEEERGYDFKYGNWKLECKVTFGKGTGWTGNGYKKEPKHILLRYSINEIGEIHEVFAMYVDLDKCVSRWPARGLASNFSTLKFQKEDWGKLNVTIGGLKENPTYIRPLMKPLNDI